VKCPRKAKNAGFTLIELMIVVAIMSIISSIAVVKTGDAIGTAHDKKRAAEIHTFRKGVYMFYDDHGFFPRTDPCSGPGDGWRSMDSPLYNTQPICDPEGNTIYPNLAAAFKEYLPLMRDPRPQGGYDGYYFYHSYTGAGYSILFYKGPTNMHNFDKGLWNPTRCGGVPNADGNCPSGVNSILIRTDSTARW